MPVFLIERRYAEQFTPDPDGAAEVNLINDDEDVRWLYSFLSADKRKTFCLYEAESAEAIRRAAARAGLPADVIIEMAQRVLPDGSMEKLGR
ncbi:MAG: nickel-binding protein [Nakamurella sp.]